MKSFSIRQVPWTCEWGRFGVVIEELGADRSRVDDVFWGCHYPPDAPNVRMTTRGECEHCPFWIRAARLQADASMHATTGASAAGPTLEQTDDA